MQGRDTPMCPRCEGPLRLRMTLAEGTPGFPDGYEAWWCWTCHTDTLEGPLGKPEPTKVRAA